jgi:hypothetical protein
MEEGRTGGEGAQRRRETEKANKTRGKKEMRWGTEDQEEERESICQDEAVVLVMWKISASEKIQIRGFI